MARPQAPTIDAPLQTSAPRALARAQPAVDTPSTAQTARLSVARQQAIVTDVPRASTVTARTITRVAAQQPLKYIQQPTQAIVTNTTSDVVVPGQVVATIATSTTTTIGETAVQQQAVATVLPTTATAATNRTINTTTGNGVTTVNNQRFTQNYQVNNPGGSNGEIQFSANGKFAADSDFKYWSDSDTLQLNGWLKTQNLQVGNVANLGHANNLVIMGGTNGEVLRTDGNGNVTWTSITVASGSNNINDGSSIVSIETNSNVNFTVGGNANVMTVTDSGAIANVFTSNNFILGNATTTISTNRWLDAVTMTTNPTVLFTAANTVSSIDVHITADDGTSKQITKMLSVTKDANTSYSQYGNVTIGTEMASFYMDQSGGLVRVIATPSSSSRVDYRLVVTLYN
jgi:hypothetical protein